MGREQGTTDGQGAAKRPDETRQAQNFLAFQHPF
jgi:hypothetical protein